MPVLLQIIHQAIYQDIHQVIHEAMQQVMNTPNYSQSNTPNNIPDDTIPKGADKAETPAKVSSTYESIYPLYAENADLRYVAAAFTVITLI